MVEAEVVDFIYDYANDGDEGKFYGPISKKRRSGICRAEKRGDFNYSLLLFLDIN